MNTNNDIFFTGPIFIIGMPRSGTKLLRDLLNQHPCIGIPDIETNFLPNWVNHWQHYGDLSIPSKFRRFYKRMLHFSYFKYMSGSGKLVQEEIWYKMCKNFTPAGVFESLLRHDSGIGDDNFKIWGDKTPSYIRYVPLLKKLYPDARFIHIIRDVRDYCLSINKAWRKNMIRAAQRWCDDVERARIDGRKMFKDYLEVRYEDLIAEPGIILKRICEFLDIEFDSQMLHLSKPSENIGDARGLIEIKKDNKEKYFHLMEPNIRRKIETIAVSTLISFGYPVDYHGEIKRINKIQTLCYKLFDGVNLFKFSIRKRGFFNTKRWNFNTFNLKK